MAMVPCSSCNRHLREADARCPFCGTRQRAEISPLLDGLAGLAFVTVLGASACATNPSTGEEGNTTTTNGSNSSSEVTTADSATSETEVTTLGDSEDDTNSDSNVSLSFYACAPSDDWWISECDPFAQDCPEGEKCVAYDSDGDDVFDANKCVAIMGDGPTGNECVYGGFVEASDDCDGFGQCYFVEDVDGMLTGICEDFCRGTADDPICDPGQSCFIAYEGSLSLCLEQCDPLAQDCPQGQGCYWANTDFMCLSAPADPLANGDACDAIDVCDLGQLCATGDILPGCNDTACCTEFCDLNDMNYVCTNPNLECVPFFEMAPQGWEHVGVCIAP